MKKGIKRVDALFAEIKTHYKAIILVLLIAASFVIIYENDIALLANEALQNEAFSHILLLPFFAAFLCYMKKDAIKAALAIDSDSRRSRASYFNIILGAILIIIAFLIYWYGSSDTLYTLEIHIVSMPIFLMGLTLLFLNARALRVLILPILFLLFLVPLPATILYSFGGVLANTNTQIAYNVLKTFGVPITLSGNYGAPTLILSTAAGNPANFSVGVPCSGVYSLMAFTMFASFLAFITLSTVFKKFLVFVIGFLVFVFLNIVRIITVVSVGYGFGVDAAMTVHSFAGLVLIFIGMLIVFGLSEKLLKIRIVTKLFQPQSCQECNSTKTNLPNFCPSCGRFLRKFRFRISKTTYAKALLLMIGSSIAFVAISAPSFSTGQNSILLSSQTYENATSFIPPLENHTLQFLFRDKTYEEVAHQELSLLYAYFPSNISEPIIYVDVGVANTQFNLHSWEVCYISYQTAQGYFPLVNELNTQQVRLQDSTIAEFLAFENPTGNYTQVTLYWFNRASFNTGVTVQQKYVRISLIVLTKDSDGFMQYKQDLIDAGNSIAQFLSPMKAQAFFSLGIPMQQALLAILLSFFLITVTTQYFTQRRAMISNTAVFSNFASYKEKTVLNVVQDLSKQKTNVRTSEIIDCLTLKVGKPVNPRFVYSIMNSLEKNGFVSKNITLVSNVPIQTWHLTSGPKP